MDGVSEIKLPFDFLISEDGKFYLFATQLVMFFLPVNLFFKSVIRNSCMHWSMQRLGY
jgi:hypothetical protein